MFRVTKVMTVYTIKLFIGREGGVSSTNSPNTDSHK